MSVKRRREFTVDEILSILPKREKEKWLRGWIRWLRSLAPRDADLTRIFGYSLTSVKQMEKLLLERCHGLTEPECYYEFEKLFEKRIEEIYAEEYIDEFEHKASLIDNVIELLGIDYPIAPHIAEEILKKWREGDYESVYRLLESTLRLDFELSEEEIRVQIEKAKAKMIEAGVEISRIENEEAYIQRMLREWRKKLGRVYRKAEEYVQRLVARYGSPTAVVVSPEKLKDYLVVGDIVKVKDSIFNKDLGITTALDLLNELENSKLQEYFRRKYGKLGELERLDDIDMVIYSDKTLIVYDADPLLCYLLCHGPELECYTRGTEPKKSVRWRIVKCNQLVFIFTQLRKAWTVYVT